MARHPDPAPGEDDGAPPDAGARADPFGDLEAQLRATRAQYEAIEKRIEERTGRNLPLAILFGLVLGAALLFSLIVVKAFYMLFAAAIIAFTAYELANALRFAGRTVPRIATIVAGVATVPAAFLWHAQGQWLVTLGGMLFVALWRLAQLARPAHRTGARAVLGDIAAAVFIQSYVAFLGSVTVLLTSEPGGEWWTLAYFIVVVCVDTGAYASGLLFGRHRLAPRISPGKTWEGFAGSIVVSIVAGIVLALTMIHVPWEVGALFGLVLAGTATLGDLVESLIKRDLGIKDISSFLPGHGGFLDRVDSALPSAAVAYAFFLLFH